MKKKNKIRAVECVTLSLIICMLVIAGWQVVNARILHKATDGGCDYTTWNDDGIGYREYHCNTEGEEGLSSKQLIEKAWKFHNID